MDSVIRNIDNLTPEQRERLAELLRRKTAVPPPDAPVLRMDRTDGVASASAAQEGIWFMCRTNPGNLVYSLPFIITIRGVLDQQALHQALAGLIARHEALRTVFRIVSGRPMQVLRRECPCSVSLMDWCAMDASPEQRRERAIHHIHQEARRPFSLTEGPLFRFVLYRLTFTEHLLFFNVHHIVFDGWSKSVFLRELLELYEAACDGRPPALPPPALQYADCAAWLETRLAQGLRAEQLAWWKERMTPFPEPLELPIGRTRPLVRHFNGRRCYFNITSELLGALEPCARRCGVTLFMLLLAAYKVLLMRYTGRNDLVVGTPVAGRSRPELEQVIGCLVNMLPLRTQPDRTMRFTEFLRQVRTVALEGFARQELPFEELVAGLNTVRDLARSPLFQTAFQFQNYHMPKLRKAQLELQCVCASTGTAQLDIVLDIEKDERGLLGLFEYDSDLFDAESIKRFSRHYLNILYSVAEQPEQTLGEIPVMRDYEKSEIVFHWNETRTEYPRDRCVHELIADQAERTPESEAVRFEEQFLSYRQLERRANQLAHYLRGQGVGPEVRVAVCLERGVQLPLVELAVWKAGGAYVPLDPVYPPERIRFMLEDSGAQLLITEHAVFSGSEAEICRGAAQPVFLDELGLESFPDTVPPGGAGPANLAYIIYTSGSTGHPKGVQIEHRAFMNFICGIRRRLGIRAEDSVLAVTTPCFDICGLDFWLPLTVGARVVLLSRETVLSGKRLAEAIEKQGTILQTVPAVWRMLLRSGWKGAPHLKMLIGGEGWPRELAEELLQNGGELWNLYGPTETAVWATAEQIVKSEKGPVSIGRPLDNVTVYILDEDRQPVPVGVPGELWIGGDGVSRGYWNRPELTAANFVTDLFSSRPLARMYRTGDLARWLPDGRIECLGRIDFQVKVRGFRIELGEVEEAMRAFPAVRQAVVAVVRAENGENELAGYFTEAPGAEVNVSALRAQLKTGLPEYMVPSFFMRLKEVPLSPNGKVNRRALPEPDTAAAGVLTDYAPPETPEQWALVRIWREVLHRDRIGIHDNFFELGGHSLLAAQMIEKISEAGYDLTVDQLFRFPTVAAMSAALHSSVVRIPEAEERWECLSVLNAGELNRVPLFFLHTAPGDVLMYASLIHRLPAWQPCYGFQSVGLADPGRAHRSIREMAAYYNDLLTEFYPSGPYMLCGWCFGGTLAQEMAVQLRAQGREVALLALFDTWTHPPESRWRRLAYHYRRFRLFRTLPQAAQKEFLRKRAFSRLEHLLRTENIQQELQVKMVHGVLKERGEVYRINLESSMRHRSRYYPGEVHVFRPDTLDGQFLPDLPLGWSVLAAEQQVYLIPGDHRALMHEPNVRVLAERLTQWIENWTTAGQGETKGMV